jgi:glycine cleavage system T protein
MKTTLLHPWHEKAGARFGPFAGFDMPIQYPMGAIEEHRLCRRSVGLFDIDHMGQVIISGPGSGEALSSLVSNKILDMKPHEARYALLLNEKGGVIDDLFIYLLEPDKWFVVVNAGNHDTDVAWFKDKLPKNIHFEDISDQTYMIAVQGPNAVKLMDSLCGNKVSPIERATEETIDIQGVKLIAGRTGYTGEDGVELYYDASKAQFIWELLLSKAKDLGIEAGPMGLAARDSLRFESGMPLHGHEITPEIMPMEALLKWACDFDKDFFGKAPLVKAMAEGLKKKLCTVNVKGGVPREGYKVQDAEGKEVGYVAAGMFCPTTGTYSANVFVPPALAKSGTALKVLIRDRPKDAVVVKRPLYLPVYRRK